MENKFNKKSIGLPGGPNEYITHISDLFSIEGYKRNSPDVNNKHNLIPSGSITMKDVDFPVHGVDNLGNEQDMYPGKEYEFPGDYVFETPMAKYGGGLLTKTMHCTSCNWKWKAADGGSDITTCHKCGGEALPKAQEGLETSKTNKLQSLMDSYKTKFKPKTLDQEIAEKLQQEKYKTVVKDNTRVVQTNNAEFTKKEIEKGNVVKKDRGSYKILENNKVIVPVDREGQGKDYVDYKTLKPGEQLSGQDIYNIEEYKKALDTQDLGALRRPLTYLSDPEKILGDIGIPGMETSEAERLYFAQRDNHPNNRGMSVGDKLFDTFKYGLNKTPGAALNVGLAMLGNPGASSGRIIAEALNPLPMPLPKRGAKINASDDLARIAKQTDNVEDTYSLARQPLNPFEPLPRNTNTTSNLNDFSRITAENSRTIYSLDEPNYVSSSELRDQADFLAGQSPLQRMLNKPIIPYTRKYALPKELELKTTSTFGNVQVNLVDKETSKVQAYLALNKYDDDWLYPGMISVDSKLQGNRIQDILYQKGIEESQKLGFKGVRSGDHLLSPDKTLKAHSRFEKVPLEFVEGKTKDNAIPISGLINHTNPRLYEDFFKHYESLPKGLKAKHSINDVYKMFSRHLSDNKSSYGLAATGIPTLAGMTDLIGMPMVDPDYEPYILDWIREREKQKRKEEELLKTKKPEFQQGDEVKYSQQNGNVVTTTKKVNTSNGPRYYQAQSPDYNFSRELVDAKAATRVGDSIPAIKLDPRIIEALKKKQQGGEETSWTAYFNPANWGTSRYDEYATFKEAFRAARAEEDSDFLWKGKRYSTELAKAYKPSTPKKLNLTGLRKGIAEAESRSGLLMVNPESTATGLYGQRFSELEGTDLYKGTRQQFAKDLAAQNKVFETRLNKGIAGNRGLIQDAEDLYSTYSKQIPQFGYSKEDLIALTNFLGRQGTRNYLGYHVRDKKPLAEALPNIYGNAKNQANKTPEDYLKIVRDFYQDGGATETMQEVVEQPQEQMQNNNVENQYLEIYKKYVSGELAGDEELEGKKIFDKLNRVYYAEAKKLNMKPTNYIMTNIIGLT